MPTSYFVRKTGNNSNAGTSAGAAWLTIAKALAAGTPVVAGDTVYVGAGTYREGVTLAGSGSVGNLISVIGDVDGVKTGDSGDVRWTGFLTNDTSGGSTAPLSLNGKSYYLFDLLQMDTGAQRLIDGTVATSHDLTFRRCLLVNQPNAGGQILADFLTVANALANLDFDRCIVVAMGLAGSGLQIEAEQNASVDYNLGVTVENCLFLLLDRAFGVLITNHGSGAFKGGGVTIDGCTFFGVAPIATNNANVSGQYPIIVQNSALLGAETAISSNASALGSIVEDNNRVFAFTARSNVTIGPNSTTAATLAFLMEWGQASLFGRTLRPFLQPAAGSPYLGFGKVSLAVGIPGAAADDATVGTIAWGTPNNAKYPNDTNHTDAALTAGTTSHYLKVTNFGFAIPAGATITQIRVEIIMNKNAGTGLLAGTGNSCKLTKDGTTFIGTDKGTSLPVPTTTNTIYSVGVANDLWGSTWVPADINSANFGVGISFKETGGANAVTPQIDYVRIIVNYTPTSLPTAQTQDLTSGPRPAGGAITNAVGAFERGNTAVKETSTTHTGANAIKLAGPSYQDFQLAVDATSTVVTCYLRYDGSYGGATLPTMQVLNGTECGVANASISQVGGANTWEQVQLTIVPTSAGIVTIRVSNLSTAAAGNVYADSFGVA